MFGSLALRALLGYEGKDYLGAHDSRYTHP